jgi:hypothetical protein
MASAPRPPRLPVRISSSIVIDALLRPSRATTHLGVVIGVTSFVFGLRTKKQNTEQDMCASFTLVRKSLPAVRPRTGRLCSFCSMHPAQG